jgi:acetyl-CoA C-acetyltransferase
LTKVNVSMNTPVIVSATRTAVGKFGGSLKDVSLSRLGSVVLKRVLEKANVKPTEVDEVIMGNVLSAGQGQNVARQIAIGAGIPTNVPSYSVNKLCGSGLKSVVLGAQAIRLGDAQVVVAGGVESMSQAPYALKRMRWGARMGNDEMVDLMIHDGLLDAFNHVLMGMTAENLVERYGITREEQDEFSAKSQNKAETAIKTGRFKEEIAPVQISSTRGEQMLFDTDETPRFGTREEILAKLKPAFKQNGTVTAGNSSGISDGAAAVLLMSEEKAMENGLQPMAVVKAYASSGVPPEVMGIGPVGAVRKAVQRAGIALDKFDLMELNEAFAATAIAVCRELGLNPERVNVNGGAIALGHPIGASGAKILVTLLHELERRKGTFGLATLCIGGGQGIAMVVER